MRNSINSTDSTPPLLLGGYTFAQNPLFTRFSITKRVQTQGDSILLKSPQGKFVLVDGGGSHLYDVGAKTLLPYLHYRGIRQLDMIINTHPDIDHLQGLESVAGEIETDYLALPESIIDRKEYQNLKSIAKSKNILVVPLRVGQFINLEEGFQIKVLSPEKEIYNGNQFNQESVVLQVRYQDFSAILTGDIPAEVYASGFKGSRSTDHVG